MKKSEQTFVVKFVSLTSLGSRAIQKELTAALGSTVYSLIQIKEWDVCFETGDLLCEDHSRLSRSPHVLGKALSHFLEELPFATARVIVEYFGQSKYAIKEILQRDLGLR
jgi:hypothetical protein